MDDTQKDDDIVFSPDESGEVSEGDDSLEYADDNLAETVKKLKKRVKELEAEAKENLNGWQRAKADYANAKREEEKTRSELTKYANENFVLELLPALDAFDMAMANKEAWEKVDSSWRGGVEYIYNQIQRVLENFGVKQENPVGETVNITKHSPIGTVETADESKKGTVAEVIQKGYTMHGKEIRPATVKVFE